MTITASNISKTGYYDEGTITLKQKPLEQRGPYPIHKPTYTGNIDHLMVLDKNWVIVSWNPYPDMYDYINTQTSGQLATDWATVLIAAQKLDTDQFAWSADTNLKNLIKDYKVAARKAIGEDDIGTTAYWAISSSDDANYATPQAPTNAYKHYYEQWGQQKEDGDYYTYLETHQGRGLFTEAYRIYTYIQMPTSMVNGKTYTITMDSGDTVSFLFDTDNTVARTIKVNQAGYLNSAAEKYAYLGGYLYKHGVLDLSHATSFQVINADTGTVAFTGTPALIEKDPRFGDTTGTHTGSSSATVMTDSAASMSNSYVGDTVWNVTDGSSGIVTANNGTSITCSGGLSGGTNNTWETGDRYVVGDPTQMYGEDVYELDFSSMTDTGTFFIKVPGVGRSWPFIHGDNAYSQAGYTIIRGLYHQRAGQAKLKPYTNWNRQNANTGPYYYECDLIYMPEHGAVNSPSPSIDPFDVVGYSLDLSQSTAQVEGGYHDAADWDCRMYHLVAAFDLMRAFEQNSSEFTDNQFNIPEGGDGIPDILSEVKYGLEVWRASQDGVTGGVSGYLETWTHPGIEHNVNSTTIYNRDKCDYAYGQRTTWSSAHYAAAAAQFARLVAPYDASLSSTWQTSAINAYNFAKNPANSLGSTILNAASNRAIATDTGTHTGTTNATVLEDTTEAWIVNELVGYELFNRTDGSRGEVTANTATTVTVSALTGGTDNQWENGDSYALADKYTISWTQDTADTDPYLVHAKCQLYLLTNDTTYLTEADSVATILARFSQAPLTWPSKLMAHHVYEYYSVIEAYNAGYTGLSSEASTWSTWITDTADGFVEALADKPYTTTKKRSDEPLLWDMSENLSWGQSTFTNYNRILQLAYQITGLEKYRTAMILNMDWMLGCNPMGMSWTTGVGYVYPICILHEASMLTHHKDPVPGITPYGLIGANKWPTTREAVWRSPFDSTGANVVSSLTQSGGTATMVCSVNHGLSTGNQIHVENADQTEYNGTHTITVTNPTTFTFSVDSGAVSPATGTIGVRVSWTDGTYQQSAPKFRMYPNNKASVAATEFTVHETMSAMAFTAALLFKNETIEEKLPRDYEDVYGNWQFV